MEKILDLLDADDDHLSLREALVEKALDLIVDERAGRNVHQAVVLLGRQAPHWRIPAAKLLQRVQHEAGRWRVFGGTGGVGLDCCPVCGEEKYYFVFLTNRKTHK